LDILEEKMNFTQLYTTKEKEKKWWGADERANADLIYTICSGLNAGIILTGWWSYWQDEEFEWLDVNEEAKSRMS